MDEEDQILKDIIDTSDCEVRVLAEKSYVEDEALEQLRHTAKLPFMKLVVGMPDLHPGKQFPIGSACASQRIIYPVLVGGDIGCGMALWKTSLKNKKLKLDKLASQLNGLETHWEGDTTKWLDAHGLTPTDYDNTLGTIGLGNHFAELQQIEEIHEPDIFESLGMDDQSLYLLVHSGSRSFGDSVLSQHVNQYGHKGLVENSEDCQRYLEQHDKAVEWARSNRSLIAHRFMACLLGNDVTRTTIDETEDGSKRLLDICHNYVEKKTFKYQEDGEDISLWLHRKGAAPTDKGPVVIPGSRGAFSYLVMPLDGYENLEKYGYSLAHGAGRKWNRGRTFEKMKNDVPNAEALKTTELGGLVICEKKTVLYEESPIAYKDIEAILSDLQQFKMIKIVATFRPLITYKMRKNVRFNV